MYSTTIKANNFVDPPRFQSQQPKKKKIYLFYFFFNSPPSSFAAGFANRCLGLAPGHVQYELYYIYIQLSTIFSHLRFCFLSLSLLFSGSLLYIPIKKQFISKLFERISGYIDYNREKNNQRPCYDWQWSE